MTKDHSTRSHFTQKRLWTGFMLVLFGVVVGRFALPQRPKILVISKGSYKLSEWGSANGNWGVTPDISTLEFEPYEDIDEGCAEWEDYGTFPNTVHTRFSLPVTSKNLFVFSKGVRPSGKVNIWQDMAASEEAEVDVIASYFTDNALRSTKVCEQHLTAGGHGVGIFTAMHGPNEDKIYLTVNVKFPASVDGSPLIINHFETQLESFHHNFFDLRNSSSMVFKSVTLRGHGIILESPIHVESGTIQGKNGAIIGQFQTSGKLQLLTSNAPINASIEVYNADEDNPAEVILQTSNHHIDSSLRLFSTARPDNTGGTFNITAHTSNGHLTLTHPVAPVDSRLLVDARTSNGHAELQLHPTFEGSYESITSNSITRYTMPTNPIDPSGRGRKPLRDWVNRTLWWGEVKERGGSALLKTSNREVHLGLWTAK